MNQDKDVLDPAALTLSSGALDDVVAIGGDYVKTIQNLKSEIERKGNCIDVGDALLLNGVVN
eukprot:CAMPEP_0176346718 /NCGR_PEP_ID=MMETSP0126-20121128/6456_1 /TAXON_ID=141414 ORGANISM="Strombidinopsis acuminatum, Strain SPMC142" /NCGR_SAMPLE_ID=MMETSP0126 /ASSEMBLY_ACC=CAM_ASM_000229 /LENGTH=61 /DNA_ID=CAMNT_0017694411 /DNA_START=1375 /DNA_END=1560 /DNA_ORIENTATION=+